MKQITVKGELVWDDTEGLEFLEAMVNRDILPKLSKETGAKVGAPAPEGTVSESDINDF